MNGTDWPQGAVRVKTESKEAMEPNEKHVTHETDLEHTLMKIVFSNAFIARVYTALPSSF